MPLYPLLSAVAAVTVVLAERCWLHTGLFRDRTYWIALAVVFAFMIPVEEFVYAFALLTLTMLLWDRAARR